ncbi:testis-specific serine/threonine-protein kinase 3 isoform X2 [Cotesia typhae]|uniref:testis-specific serine/threonine-protein kinase 3 isoform X2 n=1 Tax=Cotesia typhae TaxID=2053667 RepID=UPI003D690986
MSQQELKQSSSEEVLLKTRGYTILKKLGEGSFAKVFLAEYQSESDPDKKLSLACKIVNISKAPQDVVRKFFPRELDILMKLDHPHVVQVHSIIQRRLKYYIFMQFAESGDLLEYITKNGPVGENQARIWLRQLTLDFGFARFVTDTRGKHVLSDTFCGSLLYAAPEILKGIPYNPKIADIWSLGVILYTILNKAMPFDETNLARLYTLQTNRRWKFQRKVIDKLSDQVKKLVGNLIEPDIKKRWRIEKIVYCSWIAMEPRLILLKPREQEALNKAIDHRKSNAEKNLKKQTIVYEYEKNEKIINKTVETIGSIKIIKDVHETRFSTSVMESNLLKLESITTKE